MKSSKLNELKRLVEKLGNLTDTSQKSMDGWGEKTGCSSRELYAYGYGYLSKSVDNLYEELAELLDIKEPGV